MEDTSVEPTYALSFGNRGFFPDGLSEERRKEFDVFVCYNSLDRAPVLRIAERLVERGIRPFVDVWSLPPGESWQWWLEDHIGRIGAAAVFVGKHGIGRVQMREAYAYLREFARRGCPVIPVILPGAPRHPQLPIFLSEMTWVDFRQSDPEPLSQLAWGIGRGRAVAATRG
jgi:hypothetical protein